MSGIQQMLVAGGRRNIALTISSNTYNYTLNPAKVSGYISGGTTVTLTVNSGISVGSTTTANPALAVSGWAAGDTVSIVNNGTIEGCGGEGGRAGGGPGNLPGGAGGPALTVSYAVVIDNASGIVAGGGGGGGGGGGNSPAVATGRAGAGGGGAGIDGGIGGTGGGSGNGQPGTATAGGAGVPTQTDGGAGGDGGGRGAAGAAGAAGNSQGGQPGGAGGYCTTTGSNAYITWTNTGTRYGTLG